MKQWREPFHKVGPPGSRRPGPRCEGGRGSPATPAARQGKERKTEWAEAVNVGT